MLTSDRRDDRMKPINEMTINELAEYVVTLPGWDQDVAGIQWSLYRAKVEGQPDLEPMFLPNLRSPATLGCLLAMVRKKHGAIHVWVSCGVDGYYAVRRKTITRGPYAGAENSLPICWDDSSTPSKFRSEVHALVAALAKEAS